MSKSHVFLSKIKSLSYLLLAAAAVLISGCQSEDVFVKDPSEAQEAVDVAPRFTEIGDSNSVWLEIQECSSFNHTNVVPIVLYDNLMNPEVRATVIGSAWAVPVDIQSAIRVFNSRNKSERSSEKVLNENCADINVILLESDPNHTSHVSGILCGVNQKEFTILCERFPHHSLLPTLVSKSENDTTVYSCGYVFSVTDPNFISLPGDQPSAERFLEIWAAIDSDIVQNAYGQKFIDDFVQTTFLANGDSIESLIK
ncbi:hypothetical protein BOKEGFJH_00351 [Chlamydia avium]|nr:hypothetical protein BOKEGFJH_00351 [Chlamydia avium]